MKKLLLAAALLLLPSMAEARGKIFRFCEDGGQKVTTPGATAVSTTSVQRSYPSCTVTVYLPGTTTLATLYSTASGTAQANPFTAASTGRYSFYTDEPIVDIRLSGGGIAAPFTMGDMPVPASIVDSLMSFGAFCNGTTDDASALVAASTALGTNGGTVVIPEGKTCVIAGNVTVDQDVGLEFQGGGKFSISNTFTLTVNGAVTAGHQIFSGLGTASFATNTVLPALYAEWWGFSPGATGTQNRGYLQLAATAATGHVLRFYSNGTADVNGNITVLTGTRIVGNGVALRIRETSATVSSLFTSTAGKDVVFDSLYLYGTGVWVQGSINGWEGITIVGATGNVSVVNSVLRNFGGAAILFDSGAGFLAQGNVIEGTWVLGVNSVGQGCDTLKFCLGVNYAGEYGIGTPVNSGSSSDIRIIGNEIFNTQIGIVGGISGLLATSISGYVIADNQIHDIQGQHGIYISGDGVSITGNTITAPALDGIKVVGFTVLPARVRAWTITGNSINGAGDHAINVGVSGTAGVGEDIQSVVISGNSVASSNGINANGLGASPNGTLVGLNINGNSFRAITGNAVKIGDYVSFVRVTNNQIDSTTEHAILVDDPNGKYVFIEDNSVFVGGDPTSGAFYGIVYLNGLNGSVIHNTVVDTRGAGASAYGIYIAATPAPTTRVELNYVRNALTSNIRIDAQTQTFIGNDFLGSINMVATNEVNFAGIVTSAPNTIVLASDFTSASSTALQTITGLVLTLPATTQKNFPFHCKLYYGQATGAVSDTFGIQAATYSPTNITASGQVETAATVTAYGNLIGLATTTATAIVTFTPGAVTTIYNAYLDGIISNPSNASTQTVNIMVSQSTAANLITVKANSFCTVGL